MRCKCLPGLAVLLGLYPRPSLGATAYYVATTGSDSAAGTESAPFASVNKANSVVVAGDTVYIRGGTYKITSGTNSCASQTDTVNAITLSKSGTAGNLIKYWAAPGETPIFDYQGLMADCRVKGFLVSGNYIHLKGIEITQVKQRNTANHESWGVWISGSNNVFELLNIHHIDGTGLFIGKGGGNLVLNSDSHHNFDPKTSNGACESGDGFGAHISAGGTGNVFRGCRAWFNSDDNFDLINAFESVTIENCWAWHAGYRYDTGAACGNGNGIKAGGYGTDTSTFPANPPVHVVRGNLSVGNRAAAFYANHHPGKIIFYNNTGYASNPAFNMLGMSTSGADITVGTYRNNLAAGSKLTSNAKSPDDATNSWTVSVTVNDSDFLDVSETGLDGPRQADGSLPSIPNFHLAAGSDLIDQGTDVGLAYNGTKPDLGCFETGLTPVAGGTGNAGGATSTVGVGTATSKSGVTTGGTKAAGGTTARGGAAPTSGGKINGSTSTTSGGAGASNSSVSRSTTSVISSGGSASSISFVLGGAATATGSSTKGGSVSSTLSSSVEVVGGSGKSGQIQTSNASTPTGAPHGTESPAPGEPGGCSCRVPRTTSVEHGFMSVCALLGLTIFNTVRRRGRRSERKR